MMIPSQRNQEILQYVKQNKVCSITDVSKRFNISNVTVHRILNDLEKDRLLQKVHGGVRVLVEEIEVLKRFDIHLGLHFAEKQEIAQKALQLIDNDSTIFLDSSTTCLFIARAIATSDFNTITVISNSPVIAFELLKYQHINVISTGGELNFQLNSFTGSITLDAIEKLQVEKAFISCAGISEAKGLMTGQSALADVLRKVLEMSFETNLVIDSSKFTIFAPIVIAPVNSVQRIITDKNITKGIRKIYNDLGIKII